MTLFHFIKNANTKDKLMIDLQSLDVLDNEGLN